MEEMTPMELKAVRHIRNSFVHHGHAPTVRELQRALGYGSPRSASLILSSLISKGVLKRRTSGQMQLIRDPEEEVSNARTVDVPLVGNIACGMPILAEENIEAMIPVSKSFIRSSRRYFLLRAKGDSMNDAGIDDKDLLLVEKKPIANPGEKVIALIDDEATVKFFRPKKDFTLLIPKSKNPIHKPIIVSKDFIIQGIVRKVVKKADLAV